MRIELERIDAPFHFVATGAGNVPVHIDAAESIGGANAGARPMELLLMGLAGCSAIDVVQILTKQRLEVGDLKVTVDGDREAGAIPAVFTAIHLHFTVSGDLPLAKVERAIELSLEKYCSAAAMLGATAKIDYSVTPLIQGS